MRASSIRPSVDFEQEGVQHGVLSLPYSHDDSAWGAVQIPIAVIQRGAGPTALLTGGNHGDEYEGPIALMRLARSLGKADIAGRVIILPALNYPAFCAGRRTSPIDAGNLNRLFPGRPDGTVTEKIADYVTRYLLPMADYVLDFHSGGRTLNFLPFAAVHVMPDAAQQARCEAAMEAFNAPYAVIMREMDAIGMYDSTAEAMGKVFVTTELGGGGTATAASVRIAERGVRNLLIHAGILAGELDLRPSMRLEMPAEDSFITSFSEGVAEFSADLGEEVAAGEPLVRIYPIHQTGLAPVDYLAPRSGMLIARHHPGLARPGDCLAVIAVRQAPV